MSDNIFDDIDIYADDEDNFYKDGWEDFYKDSKDDVIWWTAPIDTIGEMCFSFDKKTVFNFFADYPHKLTPEQIKIFKKENPTLAGLKHTPDN